MNFDSKFEKVDSTVKPSLSHAKACFYRYFDIGFM